MKSIINLLLLTVLVTSIVSQPIVINAVVEDSYEGKEGVVVSIDQNSVPLYQNKELGEVILYLEVGQQVKVLEYGDDFSLVEIEENNDSQKNTNSIKHAEGYIETHFLLMEENLDNEENTVMEKNELTNESENEIEVDTNNSDNKELTSNEIKKDNEEIDKNFISMKINKDVFIGVAKKSPTNIRAEPSTKSNVKQRLPVGSVVNLLKYNDYWYQIVIEEGGSSTSGYIHKKHVTIVTPKSNTLYKGVAKREPTNIRVGASTKSKVLDKLFLGEVFQYKEFSKNWYEVTVSKAGRVETGYIHRKHFTKVSAKPNTLYKGVAKREPTNIRVGASTKSKVLDRLFLGEVFQYKEFSKNWYEVTVSKAGRVETGYIHRKHFTKINTIPKDEIVVAKRNPTNVRAGASTKAKILTQFKFGEILSVKTFSKNWYEITVSKSGRTETGYIHRKHVDKQVIKTTKYEKSLEEALAIQSNRMAKVQYSTMYVDRRALKQNKDNGRWIIQGMKWEVKNEPNKNAKTIGYIEKGITTETITVDKSGSTDEFYKINVQFISATESDIKRYLDPNNFAPNTKEFFQFLVLSQPAGTSAKDLNEKILKGKGVLAGRGDAFIAGAKKHNINELYLISHAILETGHGTSKLAQGIEVGINKAGNHELVTNENRNNLRDIRTTYNMFGIGATDSNPNRNGAIRAYREGWFSPEAAIEGGAKFIGQSYIHNQYKQDTLYKMRWNPINPGYPQYATDIGWAVKQTYNLYNYYQQLDEYVLVFDVPSYR